MKTYIVYYSKHATAKVKAQTADSARRKAWDMIKGHFTYGWTRGDFLRNATVVIYRPGGTPTPANVNERKTRVQRSIDKVVLHRGKRK